MKLVVCSLVVLMIVVGIVLSFWFSVTETLGILGFSIALLNASHNLWEKDVEKKSKEAEKQERVETTLGIGNDHNFGPVLHVKLYNPSHTKQLPIQSVTISYLWEGKDFTEPLSTYRDEEGKTIERQIMVDIEPNKSRTFIFFDSHHPGGASKSPDEKLRLTISTHAGIIKEFPAETLKPLIEMLVREQYNFRMKPRR